MSALEKLKAATAELNPDEQYELFRWWIESAPFQQRQLAALKQDIPIGIEQLDKGRYRAYDNSSLMQLADDVSQSGRQRLTKVHKDPKA